jgi:predicted NBD/HSP70 family sugar kinase
VPGDRRKTQARLIIARRNILKELHAGGPMTAREISASLGRLNVRYSVDAVTDRFEDLKDLGLVQLGDSQSAGVRRVQERRRPGRPPTFATLSDAWGIGVGVEIGRSVIRSGVVTAAGRLLVGQEARRSKEHLEPTFREAAATVGPLISALAPDQRGALVGIVVAVPAPVDRATRTVAEDVLAWGTEPLDERFGHALDSSHPPITIVNDADARAIGEGRFGFARASHSAFIVKVSRGVGGCLLRRGRVLGGFRGLGGEIGHMSVSLDSIKPPSRSTTVPRLEPDAECSSCGDSANQHLEAYASITAIERRLSIARRSEVSISTVVSEWRHRADARLVVEDASRLLGQALTQVVKLVDPEVVVITGRFAACGDRVADPIRHALAGHRPRHAQPPAVIVDGPPLTTAIDREFEWLGVRGAGRLAIELNTSADDPPVALD